MNLNPEFQRQLYLEFSQARLVGVPLILAIIFSLTYVLDKYQFAEITMRSALGLFLLIVSFWGTWQTVNSIQEEQRSHTWDTQRLSSLDPWTMVCGKLLGSTSVVWYGAAICLVVFALSTENLDTLFWVCNFAVISGLLVQSLSLLLSLIALRKGQSNSNAVIIGLAIVAAITIATWIMPLAESSSARIEKIALVSWYGIETSVHFMTFITICVALFWSIVANYRLMAQELSIRTVPWVWLVFALFLVVYTSGFVPDEQYISVFFVLGFGLCLLLCYLAVFSETHDAMRIKRLFTYIQIEDWRRSAEELPLWSVTFVLACLFGLPLLAVPPEDIEEIHLYPISVLLLLLRDIGIFLFFNYGKNPQRAFGLTVLSLLLLYGVLPGIFSAAKQQWLVAFFLPLTADSAGISLVYTVIQSVLVWYFLYQRWQESV